VFFAIAAASGPLLGAERLGPLPDTSALTPRGAPVHDLALRLVLPQHARLGERIDAHIQYLNLGDSRLAGPRHGFSLRYPDPARNRLGPSVWFQIRGPNGRGLPYVGPKQPPHDNVHSIVLKPREGYGLVVRRLERKYAFGGPGSYVCVAKATARVVRDKKLLWQGVLESNPVPITILPEKAPGVPAEALVRSLLDEVDRVSMYRPLYEEIVEELAELGDAIRRRLPEIASRQASQPVMMALVGVSRRLNDTSIVPVLLKRLGSPDDRLSPGYLGLWIAKTAGESGMLQMVQLLYHGDRRVRDRALRGLAYMRHYLDLDPVPAMTAVLDKAADPVVREQLLVGIQRNLGKQRRLPTEPAQVQPFAQKIFRWLTTEDARLPAHERQVKQLVLRIFGDAPLKSGVAFDIERRGCRFELRNGRTTLAKVARRHSPRDGAVNVKIARGEQFALMAWPYSPDERHRLILVLFRSSKGKWKVQRSDYHEVIE